MGIFDKNKLPANFLRRQGANYEIHLEIPQANIGNYFYISKLNLRNM